jgi:hypothetical protein
MGISILALLIFLIKVNAGGLPLTTTGRLYSWSDEKTPSARKVSVNLIEGKRKQNARRANELNPVWYHMVCMDLYDLELDPTRTETVNITNDPYMQDGSFEVILYKKDANGDVINRGNGKLDLSFVYSDDLTKRASLRMGSRGKLQIRSTNKNETSWLNRLPIDQTTGLYIAGDDRINDHAGFAMIALLFLRNHNRLAETIAFENKKATDDEVFDKARIQNIHHWQKVSTLDLGAAISGGDLANGYKSPDTMPADTDVAVENAFVAVAGTNILAAHSRTIPRLDTNYREVEKMFISEWDIIGSAPEIEDGEKDKLDDLLRGYTFLCHNQPNYPSHYWINKAVIDAPLINEGYTIKKGISDIFSNDVDLLAAAIVRTRDMGVPRIKGAHKGTKFVKATFSTVFASDGEHSAKMKAVYGGDHLAGDIALLVFSDEPAGTSQSLSTASINVLRNQLLISAQADPNWFGNSLKFSKYEQDSVYEFRLKNLIEYNTGVSSSLANAFFQADGQDNVMSEALSSGLHDGEEMTWHKDHDEFDQFTELDAWFGVSTRVVNDEIIEFLMEAKSTGWISIGFVPEGRSGHGMLDTDMVRCWIKEDVSQPSGFRSEIADMMAYQIGPPKADIYFDPPANDDLINGSVGLKVWEEDGHTLCTFARKLDTNDTQDFPFYRGNYKGTYAYSYMGDDAGYHGPTRGFFDTVFWPPIPEVIVEEEEDPLPKILAGAIITGVLGIAVAGYYYYNKKKGGGDFQLDKAMSEDEQRKRDLKNEMNLHIFWLCLDCFDLGTDVASLIFAISGAVGTDALTFIYAAFVSLSIAVSSRVLTTRTKKVIDATQQLKGNSNAKILGNATYRDLFIELGKSKRSLAKVQPVDGEKKKEVKVDQAKIDQARTDAKFKAQILDYADAVTGIQLIRWILILMAVEDIPSFIFNIYFLIRIWPCLYNMEIPTVSLLITVLSIGYKLAYLQKYVMLLKKKSTEERAFEEMGIDHDALMSAVNMASRSKKKQNRHVEGAFA